MSGRAGVRLLVASALALSGMGGFVAGGSPAGAHVSAGPAVADDGGTTTFPFTYDHGCGTSSTVELRVQLPEGARLVGTTQPEGWIATPEEDSVRWTGPPIAPGEPVAYSLTTTRFGVAGEAFWFPAIQRCEQGEHSWISLDAAAAEPAPFVVLDARTAAETARPAGVTAPVATAGSGDGATGAQVAGVIVTAAALAAAGSAALGVRRRDRRS